MQQQHRKLVAPTEKRSQAVVGGAMVRRFPFKPGVLVVDDEHLVGITVQRGLERNGFAVWLAGSGREAIALYRGHQADIAVVLLDIRMPGLDGPQTLGVLRELNPKVRACFMSGDTGAYEPDELLQRGASSVIVKPFGLDDLANILWPLVQDLPANPLPPARIVCGEL